MKKIEVNTAMLQNDLNRITEDIEAIRAEINNTYEGIMVLDGMWDGEANRAFNIQFSRDRARLLETCEALERYLGKIEEVKAQYESSEDRVADIVAALRI